MISDVIIVSKDRPKLLFNQLIRVKEKIPDSNIIIVNSSEKLNPIDVNLYELYSSRLIHTPNAKLGYARQMGLFSALTDYVVWLDDDIIIDKDWYKKMIKSILANPYLLSVSSRIIYTGSDILNKIYSIKRGWGISGGCCIMNRKIALGCGGYDINIHWGEDAEFIKRAKYKYGYSSIRDNNIYAYHVSTLKHWLKREWDNRVGLKYSIHYKEVGLFRMFIRKLFGLICMPFYYVYLTRDLRTYYYYFAYRLIELIGFISFLYSDKIKLGSVKYE